MKTPHTYHKFLCVFACLMVLFCQFASIAYSAETKTVTSELNAFIVTHDKDGKEVLTLAKEGHPGDIIEYQLTLTNNTDDKVKSLLATLPIPDGSEYQDQTAAPIPVLASLDGKTFATVPLTRKVKDKDGKEVTEVVPCSEYRALRWEIAEIESGKSVMTKSRVKITEGATK